MFKWSVVCCSGCGLVGALTLDRVGVLVQGHLCLCGTSLRVMLMAFSQVAPQELFSSRRSVISEVPNKLYPFLVEEVEKTSGRDRVLGQVEGKTVQRVEKVKCHLIFSNVAAKEHRGLDV